MDSGAHVYELTSKILNEYVMNAHCSFLPSRLVIQKTHNVESAAAVNVTDATKGAQNETRILSRE